jgi:hypothetical protein
LIYYCGYEDERVEVNPRLLNLAGAMDEQEEDFLCVMFTMRGWASQIMYIKDVKFWEVRSSWCIIVDMKMRD